VLLKEGYKILYVGLQGEIVEVVVQGLPPLTLGLLVQAAGLGLVWQYIFLKKLLTQISHVCTGRLSIFLLILVSY
jgi:hypothetical protein